jgi:hypothetical protein
MNLNKTEFKALDAAMQKAIVDAAIEARRVELMPSLPVIAQATGGIVMDGTWAKDATQGLSFFISQLAHTEAQVFQRQYVPMQYKALVPISSEAGEYAESVRYETYDSAGMGRRASSRPDDINTVDVTNSDKSFDIAPGDIGYHYTQQEILQSAYLKRPLQTARMIAAVDGFERHINQVALFGERDFKGLFNLAGVPTGNAPSVTPWATSTPDKILADLNAGLITVMNSSSKNDIPDTILMPLNQFSVINSVARSANSDTTILQFFLENNLAKSMGRKLEVKPAYGLETAGTGNTPRMMFYINNSDRIVMHLPMSLRFLAPQLRGQSVYVPGMYRYSGVECRYIKSAYYMEGI